MKCPQCGRETQDQMKFCGWCGADMTKSVFKKEKPIEPEVMDAQPSSQPSNEPRQNQGESKSRLVAGLLGVLLGGLGIHNFYLGNTQRGVTQLLLGTVGAIVVVGPIISGIWGLIEGIQILVGDIKTDARGVPLKE